MNTETKQEPVLRFSMFLDDWKESTLGSIAKFSKGKGISKADIAVDGNIECIRYGELYTRYGETIREVISKTNLDVKELVFSEVNDVIIPASGETEIDIATASCILKAGIALGGDLNIIKTENNGVFLSYYLNNRKKVDIAAMAQGVSVVHLYSSQLKNLKLSLPSFPEQQKIASFLTAIDAKIELLTKKKTLLEQYKKGVMQQLFSQQIRFNDENGEEYPEWEEKHIGDICQVKRGASPRPITDKKWFDTDSEIGWVRISDVSKSNKYLIKTEQYLSSAGIKRSRLVKRGNMIMSICATIGKPIYTSFDVCIHDGFVVFDKLDIDQEFFYYYLLYVKDNWYKYGQSGTQINLNSDIVSNELINIPEYPEQKKIASFLSVLDLKANNLEAQIESTKTFKKGLLQQLFV